MPIELPPKCPFFYCNSFTFNTKIEKDYQRRCKYLKQKRAFLRLPNSHLHSHHINIKQNKRYHRDTYTHITLHFVSNCIINNFYHAHSIINLFWDNLFPIEHHSFSC